jgi:hypothetical protein
MSNRSTNVSLVVAGVVLLIAGVALEVLDRLRQAWPTPMTWMLMLAGVLVICIGKWDRLRPWIVNERRLNDQARERGFEVKPIAGRQPEERD